MRSEKSCGNRWSLWELGPIGTFSNAFEFYGCPRQAVVDRIKSFVLQLICFRQNEIKLALPKLPISGLEDAFDADNLEHVQPKKATDTLAATFEFEPCVGGDERGKSVVIQTDPVIRDAHL